MASNTISEDSSPGPTSILTKSGAGKNQPKSWGNKATDIVRFSQYVSESQRAGMLT